MDAGLLPFGIVLTLAILILCVYAWGQVTRKD